MIPTMTNCNRLQTARDKERRKRKPGPLLLAGFCLPKALQPVLPIYLQGMLQVWPPVFPPCLAWAKPVQLI